MGVMKRRHEKEMEEDNAIYMPSTASLKTTKAWIMKKPDAKLKEEIDSAVAAVYAKIEPEDLSMIHWKTLALNVVKRLQKEKDQWKWFNTTFQDTKNPLFAAIYHATRDYQRKSSGKTVAKAKAIVAANCKIVTGDSASDGDDEEGEGEGTTSFGSQKSAMASPAKKNPGNVGKRIKKPAEMQVAPGPNDDDPPGSPDSKDYDYSSYMEEDYWKRAVAMKRNIKRLSKQLEKERMALTKHFQKMACFFHLEQQDSD